MFRSMFSREDFDVVSFHATDKYCDSEVDRLKKNFRDSTSQTEKEAIEKGSQSVTSRNLEVQTEEVVQSLNTDYNEDKLASFLTKICPSLMDELDKIEKSKAFTLYQSTKEEQYETKVNVIHNILSDSLPELPGVRISCIDWSCTENVVILAYESTEHSDWCAHSSRVDFYNIKTSDFDGKTPMYSMPTTSCVTSLAAHPYEPAIIAVGTAGGEVHIWNLQKGEFDADIGNSVFHEERVTKLSWENINSQLYLVSSSVDSYMFFYKVTPSISSVQLSERYVMTNDNSRLRAGILNFAFSIQPGVFAVALENGEIIHCSTFGAPNIPSSSAKNPILRNMCKKTALVVDMQFSPFVEHIFVAAFSNNTFEVYSLKETSSMYQIFLSFDIMGVCWSKLQGNILLAWGRSSKLCTYNSENGRLIAELKPEGDSLPLMKSISFCAKSPRLAVSGNDGNVVIWDIPKFFKV